MGDEELGLMTMGRVWGEDESSLYEFGVRHTTYKLIQCGDCIVHNNNKTKKSLVLFSIFISYLSLSLYKKCVSNFP